MAGSAEYLTLLDKLEVADRDPAFPLNQEEGPLDWELIDACWNQLVVAPNEQNLYALAHTALRLYAQERRVNFADVILTSKTTHIRKNAGYAGADQDDPWANFRESERFPGIPAVEGVYVRMGDKYIRIRNLRRDPNNEQVGESILDTLIDLAAYALIAICLLREKARSLMN